MIETTKHPASETHETYTYCGITAPYELWQSIGLERINWAGDTIEFPRHLGWSASPGEIIEARIQSGDTGEKALVWLISDRRRRNEERSRNEAMVVSATAQRKAGDDAIHAARIHRQAEELRCLAAGISRDQINSRLK